MQRFAFAMQLRPGFEAEYKRRHDEIWPELARELQDAGVSDYSIYLDPESLTLFAVQKLSPDNTAEGLPERAVASGDSVLVPWPAAPLTGSKGHAAVRNAPGMPHNDWDNELFLLTDAVEGATGKEPWTDLPAALPRPLEQFIDAVVRGKGSHLVSVRETAYGTYVMEMIWVRLF